MPHNAQGKPCGTGGNKKSTVQSELLEILQNNDGLTRQDIRRLMHYRYCPTTINHHLATLRKNGQVECYVNGNVRKPLYRVVM